MFSIGLFELIIVASLFIVPLIVGIVVLVVVLNIKRSGNEIGSNSQGSNQVTGNSRRTSDN